MTKIAVKPIHIFAEIRRIDEEARTFDAYAFVNEVVDGEGGLRLKRSAMVAATPDYMEWANVRRMHEPDAVAVAQSVVWDDTGAAMVVAVHDDDAWNKVKNRVYKGLSVGVAATVMRGKDVEACRWYETSLVDRPKDPDAKILAFRAEGVQHGETFEAELEEPIKRSFNDYLDALQDQDTRDDLQSAWYLFMDSCWDCMDDPAALQVNLDQFAAYCKTVIGGGADEARGALDAAIKRRAEGSAIADPLITKTLERAVQAETELARVQTALTTSESALAVATERVLVLEKMPDNTRPGPVRYPAALARTFTANEAAGVDPERVQALQAKLASLTTELPKEPDERKRRAGVAEYMAVERELNELGVPAA